MNTRYDSDNSISNILNGYDYVYVNTAIVTPIANTEGYLHSIFFDKSTSGVLTIYDSLINSGKVIISTNMGLYNTSFFIPLKVHFGIVLTVDTSLIVGAINLSLFFRKSMPLPTY